MLDIDYSKISITAKLVAYFRQFSDIPFAQEVSEHIGAKEALLEIARKIDDGGASIDPTADMPEEGKVYAPILEARYKSIVGLILKSGVQQVLELASGFSLRGLAMCSNPHVSYVESDLPGINEEKSKLIADLRSKHDLPDSGNHHVATANALDFAELEAATSPLRRDRSLIVVNEGLIPYLSAQERSDVARNVHKLLSMFAGGAWITPDFSTRKLAEDVSEKIQRFRKAITGATDRQLHEAAFEDEEAIEAFIREHGFSGQCSYQADEVEHLASIDRLGLAPRLIEHLRPRMRIWLLTPQ